LYKNDSFSNYASYYIRLNNLDFYTNYSEKLMGEKLKAYNENVKMALDSIILLNLYLIGENELLLLNKTKGGQIVSVKNDTLKVVQHFFKDDFLSCATFNNKGSLFFGSFGEGIKVVPRKNVTHQLSKELYLGITTSPSNNVFVSTRSGKIYDTKKIFPIEQYNHNIDYIYYNNVLDSSRKVISERGKYNLSSIKDIYPINDSLLVLALNAGIWVVFNNDNTPLLKALKCDYKSDYCYKLTINKRCKTVAYSSKEKTIYYSTNFGVFSRKWTSEQSKPLLYLNQSFLCNDLEIFDDKVVCATRDFGLLFFKNGVFNSKLNLKDGLLSNTVKLIKVKNKLLYILTKKGMQVYDLSSNQFLAVGIAEGVVNPEEITNFSVSNDKLWLLEKHKYYSVPIADILTPKSIGKLYLDSIVVNRAKIKYLNKTSFTAKENAFSFYYDYRNIESKEETTISFILDGFYDNWKTISVSKNKIEFQSLPVGKYVFKLKANYRRQETKTFQYQFEILPPFWQRWWFYILIIFLSGIIVWQISRIRLKRIKIRNKETLEREVLSKDLAQTKLKALRSQMNPHFIFNSLNSIQDLVLQEDVDKSYDYIVLFADLVRSTLTHSDQDFITIDKELDFLKTYLELEKLRFGDDFSYTVNYTGNEDLKIPSLVVQPFIENALLHGLLHKKGKKKLNITFVLDKQLICIIEDNGIGREKSGEIKKRQNNGHASFSTQAIKKRMEILSAQFNMETSFEYEDLMEGEEILGTRVIIKMPFQLF